ncbi:MAG: glycosyltransferase family 2 protein [Lachnospiraceae bacterium]
MQHLFTIGIASYNYEKFLKKSLEAIKRQKFKDYEVLISDDCSTDQSVAMIREFMRQNPEMDIRLIESKKNEGLIANKNKIIQSCEGEYLILCDADDWMDEKCLEKIAEEIKKENPDRVIVEVAHIGEDGKIIQVEHIPKNQTKWGWNIHHGCANKVSILREHDIKIKGTPDDVYFTIEFAKYCKKVSVVNEVLYYWLVHLDSEGRKIKQNVSEESIAELVKCIPFIGETIQYIEERNDMNMKKDREELRLVMLKLYYFTIFFSFQKFSLKQKLFSYRIIKSIMQRVDESYLSNSLLKDKQNAPLREYAMQGISIGVLLEKLHLMPLALVGYHILTKFKYFDQ